MTVTGQWYRSVRLQSLVLAQMLRSRSKQPTSQQHGGTIWAALTHYFFLGQGSLSSSSPCAKEQLLPPSLEIGFTALEGRQAPVQVEFATVNNKPFKCAIPHCQAASSAGALLKVIAENGFPSSSLPHHQHGVCCS